MKVFVLKTDLFPENDSLDEAIAVLVSSQQVFSYDSKRPNLTDMDWDSAVLEILDSDHILTL